MIISAKRHINFQRFGTHASQKMTATFLHYGIHSSRSKSNPGGGRGVFASIEDVFFFRVNSLYKIFLHA